MFNEALIIAGLAYATRREHAQHSAAVVRPNDAALTLKMTQQAQHHNATVHVVHIGDAALHANPAARSAPTAVTALPASSAALTDVGQQ